MPSLSSFPKIFTIGTSYIVDLLNGSDVEVTEKIDGSQFVFGKINGKLLCRSKGQEIFPGSQNKMFDLAVARIQEMALPEGVVYYCEYLQKPKHNVLEYSRTPKNNLVLYGVQRGVGGEFVRDREEILYQATHLGIDPVPLLLRGKVSILDLSRCLEQESYLGGQLMEGVVVKDYSRQFLLGGQPMPLMAGKLVRESFKEIHRAAGNPSSARSSWDTYKESYRTEARWEKAIQHLRDDGKLLGEPADIGPLIKEVRRDITEEAKTEIMAFLWREFGEELLRKSVAGLPEWYKGRLAGLNDQAPAPPS